MFQNKYTPPSISSPKSIIEKSYYAKHLIDYPALKESSTLSYRQLLFSISVKCEKLLNIFQRHQHRRRAPVWLWAEEVALAAGMFFKCFIYLYMWYNTFLCPPFWKKWGYIAVHMSVFLSVDQIVSDQQLMYRSTYIPNI